MSDRLWLFGGVLLLGGLVGVLAWTSNPKTATGPLVLLDRDGTINEDVGPPGVIRKEQLSLIPGAAGAIGSLKRAGLSVALVTNQSCVGKGLISDAELAGIHELLQELLIKEDVDAKLDAIYACTSVGPSPRKKPEPGMLLEAIDDFGSSAGNCVYVGDAERDMRAAAAIGAIGYLVSTGYGASIQPTIHKTLPDANIHAVKDLQAAVQRMLACISAGL